jgi:hypothetical protein
MRYRRLLLTALVTGLMVLPTAGVSASECPSIEGNALLKFGDNSGFANVDYDGERLRVHYFGVGFVETGENTADIFFVWEFPQGDVVVVEHSTATPKGGPAIEFNSTIDVLDGGSGHWTWSGTANGASATAAVGHISGELCIDN